MAGCHSADVSKRLNDACAPVFAINSLCLFLEQKFVLFVVIMEDRIKLSNYKDVCACQEVISRDYLACRTSIIFFVYFRQTEGKARQARSASHARGRALSFELHARLAFASVHVKYAKKLCLVCRLGIILQPNAFLLFNLEKLYIFFQVVVVGRFHSITPSLLHSFTSRLTFGNPGEAPI